MKKILNKILDDKSLFVLIISLCFGLLFTNKLENAYIFGIIFLINIFISNLIILIFKKLSTKYKLLLYLIISIILISVTEIIINKYIPAYSLKIYLPLLLISQMVFAKEFIAKNEKTLIKSVKIGFLFLLLISFISLFREILETNTITVMDSLSTITGYKAIYKLFSESDLFPFSFMNSLALGLLLIGLIIAFYNKIKGGNNNESN